MTRNDINFIYDSLKKIDRAYEYWAAKHGLTLYELDVYYTFIDGKKDKITQKDLCDCLYAPKTSVNSVIKKQIETGRIEMQVNPDNKREKIIVLTDRGRKFAEEIIYPLFKCEEDAINSFTAGEIDAVVNIQTKFANTFMDKVREHNE